MKISDLHTKRGNNAMNSRTPNTQIEGSSRFCHTCLFYHFSLLERCKAHLKHSIMSSLRISYFNMQFCACCTHILPLILFKATQRVCNCYFVLFSGPTLWHTSQLTFPFCPSSGDMTWTTWFRRVWIKKWCYVFYLRRMTSKSHIN